MFCIQEAYLKISSF